MGEGWAVGTNQNLAVCPIIKFVRNIPIDYGSAMFGQCCSLSILMLIFPILHISDDSKGENITQKK